MVLFFYGAAQAERVFTDERRGGGVQNHRGKINREAVQVACFMERQEPEKTGAVF